MKSQLYLSPSDMNGKRTASLVEAECKTKNSRELSFALMQSYFDWLETPSGKKMCGKDSDKLDISMIDNRHYQRGAGLQRLLARNGVRNVSVNSIEIGYTQKQTNQYAQRARLQA